MLMAITPSLYERQMALLITHTIIHTFQLSLSLSLNLGSDIIGNASVFASDSLLALAVSKQLLVYKRSLLFRGKASNVRGRHGGVVFFSIGERLDVLVG